MLFRWRIEGVRATERTLAAIRRRLALNIMRAIAKRRTAIKRELRRRVPRDTGELGRSAIVRRRGRTVNIGFSAPYAGIVKFRQPIEGASNCREALLRYIRSPAFHRVFTDAVDEAWRTTLNEAQRSR